MNSIFIPNQGEKNLKSSVRMDWVCDNKAISFHRRDKLPSWKKDGINCCEDSQLTGHVTCYLGKK
jgi:hypothetical protein